MKKGIIKTTFAMMMALMICFLFVGCGGAEDTASEEDAAAPAVSEEDAGFDIATAEDSPEFVGKLEQAKDRADIEDIRVKVLGKKGELTAILKSMGQLSKDERKELGQAANKARAEIEQLINNKFEEEAGTPHTVASRDEYIDSRINNVWLPLQEK